MSEASIHVQLDYGEYIALRQALLLSIDDNEQAMNVPGTPPAVVEIARRRRDRAHSLRARLLSMKPMFAELAPDAGDINLGG